jgi:hypothetical protein
MNIENTVIGFIAVIPLSSPSVIALKPLYSVLGVFPSHTLALMKNCEII